MGFWSLIIGLAGGVILVGCAAAFLAAGVKELIKILKTNKHDRR